MEPEDHKYNIITTCSDLDIETVVHDWWEGVDMTDKTVHADGLPGKFHGRYTAKDLDGSPAAVHVILSIDRKDAESVLRVTVQLNTYTRDYHGMLEDVVCSLVRLLKEKDPGVRTKKGYLLQRKIEC